MTQHLACFLFINAFVLTQPFDQAFSQPLHLTVRQEDSQVEFSITKWAVFQEEGRFKDLEGTILFDPLNPAATSVDITIWAMSIDSQNEGRDRALRSEEFFYVERFPTLTFKSVRARALDPSTLEVEGDITIRGVTKRVAVPVKVIGLTYAGRELGTLVGFESTFTLNREDFHLGEGWHIIGKEATIHLLIGAGTVPATARR